MITIILADADAAEFRDTLRRHVAGEVAAACEPSGYAITVSVDAIEGAVATLELGSRTIPLGRAEILAQP